MGKKKKKLNWNKIPTYTHNIIKIHVIHIWVVIVKICRRVKWHDFIDHPAARVYNNEINYSLLHR